MTMNTWWITPDEIDMIDTAVVNAEYIWTETKDDQKLLRKIKEAYNKIPCKSKINKPIKVKFTDLQSSALWDAIIHDIDYVQKPAWVIHSYDKEEHPNLSFDSSYEDIVKTGIYDESELMAIRHIKAYENWLEKCKLEKQGCIHIDEINTDPKYQPPAEFFEEPEIKFEVNEDCNYYTIRQKYKKDYYDNGGKKDEEWMDLKDGAGHGIRWHNKFQIAIEEKEINENETLQVFYDKLLKTGYNEIKPPKKWLVMKVNDFIRFVLDDLHFYWLSAKKKKFISLFINYYIQQSETIKKLSKNYKKLDWNPKTKRLE